MVSFKDRLQHGWNAFVNADKNYYRNYGPEYSARSDRMQFTRGNKQSIVASIYNQIAVDCAQIRINHSRVDENGKFLEVIDSGLNSCITLEANIDQTGRAFIQDVVQSMLDEGVVAIVPIETTINPIQNGGYDIQNMRTGRIKGWYPQHVRVDVYDERTGRHREIILPKRNVAIVENPLYSIMNEPNSTLQRLIRKMNLLDMVDEQNSSGKLDLIIQLPYTIKSLQKRIEAKRRRKEIEDQLVNSKYGIAYADGTERITQLNRPVDNNLVAQVDKLQTTLYSQLGLTESIFNGTADEATMINYHNRTIEPILSAITDEMKRKFLTKTARTRGQSITFNIDPFRLTPTTVIADIADKLITAEVLTPNEVRSMVGYKPVDDEKADELRNRHLNEQPPMEDPMAMESPEEELPPEEQFQEELTDEDYEQMGREVLDAMFNNTT